MIKLDRRLIRNFDWIIFFAVVVLSLVGIITIYSATKPPEIDGIAAGVQPDFYLKQILWLSIGIIGLLIAVIFDYKWLYKGSYIFYGLGLVLLLVVLFAGETSMGVQRWLSIGPISFQPSEFFKILFIIGFSSYLTNLTKVGQKLQANISIKSVLIFAILPFILVIKQPNLGTALLIMSLFVILSMLKGISKKVIVLTLLIGLISIFFLGDIFWEGLRDYQKSRLIAFVDPGADPFGAGYHITQSKISIGSGGFWGKGYLEGTQGPLRFLPEKHTDFIFSIFAEEWGFAGSVVLFSIYLMLFLRGLDIAVKAKDEFGRLMALGITAMFFIYFCVNIGMTVGIMPVVGVPLPFISYGGTALLSNFIAAGILININIRKFELFSP